MPAKSERELFQQLIRILAKQFDAPAFEPHLTLFATRQAQTSPAKILQSLTATPVRLRIRGTAFSRKFTKTLFVRFRPNQSLENLVNRLGQVVKAGKKVLRDPHLSLLYAKLPAPVKAVLASAINLPFREVVFDSVKAVRCISPTQTGADVESWRVMATKRLSG